jgi:hypothetical protein
MKPSMALLRPVTRRSRSWRLMGVAIKTILTTSVTSLPPELDKQFEAERSQF